MAKQKQPKFKHTFVADKEVRRIARDRMGQPPASRVVPDKKQRLRGHALEPDPWHYGEEELEGEPEGLSDVSEASDG